MNKKYFPWLACLVVAVGVAMFYRDHYGAEMFEANGIVTDAQWNTWNHQMSLFVIQEKRSKKKLHNHRVTLTPEQIKVGDTFKKDKWSKLCEINGVSIQCVN